MISSLRCSIALDTADRPQRRCLQVFHPPSQAGHSASVHPYFLPVALSHSPLISLSFPCALLQGRESAPTSSSVRSGSVVSASGACKIPCNRIQRNQRTKDTLDTGCVIQIVSLCAFRREASHWNIHPYVSSAS
jgi:hypothetical protein